MFEQTDPRRYVKGHRRVKTDLHQREYKTNRNDFEGTTFKLQKLSKRSITEQKQNYSRSAINSTFRQSLSTNSDLTKQKINFDYNKWYIQPNIRMKRSLVNQDNQTEQNGDFAYNRLYEQTSYLKDLPFMAVANKKLQLLQKIPSNNLKLLEGFRKNQELKKKRVPKIVQLFLKRKNQNAF